ncbi:MAG TPA: ATP-binding cassette domain-containing protein [Chloroflexota bacterium]|nr:ATP-binding cassette domain-containing protein [Chloroflexota bacterium]
MIEVDDIFYRYPGSGEDALRGVSLRVEPEAVIGIVGPNGSGKSTVSRLMKGLLLPTAGVVRVDGIDSRTESLEVRRRVGLVFQNPNSQIVNTVVEYEVAFGPENLGLPSPEIGERVAIALAAVGLEGHEASECHSLSMADKQRVAIASVLAMHPRYLILDEPTAWLEPVARRRLLTEVVRWTRTRGVGLVLVTHRMDEAQICDRLYGMLDGRIEMEGTPEEVLLDERARARLALSVPEAYELTRELHAAGLPVAPGEPLEQVAEALCPF